MAAILSRARECKFMPRRETRRLWGANGSQMRPQSFVSCVPHLPAHSPVHRYFNEWPMAHHLRLGLHTPSKRRRSLLQIDDNGASGYHHFLGVTVPQIPGPTPPSPTVATADIAALCSVSAARRGHSSEVRAVCKKSKQRMRARLATAASAAH